MKAIFQKAICLICLTALLVLMLCPAVSAGGYPLPADKALSAKAALVMYLGVDQSGDVLMFEKDADTRLAPAGLVRLAFGMYAVEAMAQKGLDGNIATAAYTEKLNDLITGTGLATVEMTFGETWKLNDLLTICMIQTAADAAATLVSALAETPKAFVDGMNTLVQQQIGCTDTAFANVYGLDDPAQYTTARDMYKMMRYLTLHYPQLQKMLSLSEYTVTPVAGGSGESSWPTTNELLRQSSDSYYQAAQFGKTGYTGSAGYSLVSVATNENYQYLAVVLGSSTPATTAADAADADEPEGPHFVDSKMLYRWMFNDFYAKTIMSKGQPVGRIPLACAWGTDSLALVAGKDFVCLVEEGTDLSNVRYNLVLSTERAEAAVTEGQNYGLVEVYTAAGVKLGQTTAVAGQAVNRSEVVAIWSGFVAVISSPWLWGAFVLLGLGVVGFLLFSRLHGDKADRKPRKKMDKFQ